MKWSWTSTGDLSEPKEVVMEKGNPSKGMLRSDRYPLTPLPRVSRYPSAPRILVPPLSLCPVSRPAPLPPYPVTPIVKLCAS